MKRRAAAAVWAIPKPLTPPQPGADKNERER